VKSEPGLAALYVGDFFRVQRSEDAAGDQRERAGNFRHASGEVEAALKSTSGAARSWVEVEHEAVAGFLELVHGIVPPDIFGRHDAEGRFFLRISSYCSRRENRQFLGDIAMMRSARRGAAYGDINEVSERKHLRPAFSAMRRAMRPPIDVPISARAYRLMCLRKATKTSE